MKTKIADNLRRVAEGISGVPGMPMAPQVNPADGLPDAVHQAICGAIVEAKHNACSYRQAASTLKSVGFKECSKYFKCMASKWHDNAKSLAHYIENRGGVVCFLAVPAVEPMPGDPGALAETYFNLEKHATEAVESLMAAADAAGDVITHEHMAEKLEGRVKMEKCARQFRRFATLAAGDAMGLEHELKHWLKG